MINIRKLKNPTKRSGQELAPKTSIKVKGVTITNTNSYPVWVDKFVPFHQRK